MDTPLQLTITKMIGFHRSNTDALQRAIDFAKLQMKAISNQTQSLLDMNQIISAGPFLYAFLAEVRTRTVFPGNPFCFDPAVVTTYQIHSLFDIGQCRCQIIFQTSMSSEVGSFCIECLQLYGMIPLTITPPPCMV